MNGIAEGVTLAGYSSNVSPNLQYQLEKLEQHIMQRVRFIVLNSHVEETVILAKILYVKPCLYVKGYRTFPSSFGASCKRYFEFACPGPSQLQVALQLH